MKRVITLLLIAQGFIMATFAQSVTLGVKGGLSIESLSGDGLGKTGSKNSPTIGAFAEIKFSKYLSLQPELYYISHGADLTDLVNQGLISQGYQGVTINAASVNLNYLEIPVLLKASTASGPVNFFVETGPFIGFKLSAKTHSEYNGVSSDNDVSSQFNGTNFGLQFGGGLSFLTGPIQLIVDARYGLGLTNVDNSQGTASNKTSAIMITAGLGARLGR